MRAASLRSLLPDAVVLVVTVAALASAGCSGEAPTDPEEPTPITERPTTTVTHQCRVDRDRTDHSPRQWSDRQAMVTTQAGAFFARLEGTSPDPLTPVIPGRPRLLVSSVAPDGSFGEPVTLSTAEPETMGGVTLVPTAAGFTALWVEGASLRLAGFDSQGVLVAPARTLSLPGVSRDSRPRVAAGSDGGFGIVYRTVVEGQPSEVRFVALDAAFATRGPARQVGTAAAAYADPGASIARHPEGYALLWRGPSGTVGQILFALTDRSGAEIVAARPVSTPRPGVVIGGTAGFDPTTTALLPVDGGFLAAWTELRFDPQAFSGAWSIVRVARLSPSGVVQGAPAALRPPTVDIDEVEPSLVPLGDTVAVLWGRGTHIYICGGCVPDHRIDVLLIDPVTLAPRSNVVSVGNGGGNKAGGLLRREVAVLGSSLLTTFNLTFHVHATPGSASFVCERR
jgi:hypothetical protein